MEKHLVDSHAAVKKENNGMKNVKKKLDNIEMHEDWGVLIWEAKNTKIPIETKICQEN